MKEIAVSRLREAFSYDPETGVLMWRVRPVEHFSSDKGSRVFNSQFAGRVAGSVNSEGYLDVRIAFDGVRRRVTGHRVAFALMHGRWPEYEIDHINGRRDDNRLINLREATDAQQSWNRNKPSHNTNGFPGASRGRAKRRWQARIRAAGRCYHLGYFDTPELAHAVYLQAKARLHLFNPVPRAA